jgi:hypothetical protein
MGVRLPDLAKANCEFLVACGEIQTEDKKLLKWLAGQETLVARYGKSGGRGVVQVFFDGTSGKSLHLEVIREEVAAELPVKMNRLTEVQKALNQVTGQEVDGRVEGNFAIPEDRLPPIIKSNLAETTAEGVSIRVAGGILAVSGSPIDSIRWWRVSGGMVAARLAGRRRTTIAEDYLESALELVESAFEVFLRGGGKHGGTKAGA